MRDPKTQADDAADRALLARCVAGEQAAWNALVERFSRYVYFLIERTAARYEAHFAPDERADLHNDLFVALLEDNMRRLRLFEGRNGCSVRSWIRVITVRRTLDALRRRKVSVALEAVAEFEDTAASPLEVLLASEQAAKTGRVAELFQQLSPSDQLLLDLIYVKKLSVAETCAALRLKPGAMYTRKTRLVQRLRRLAVEAGWVDGVT